MQWSWPKNKAPPTPPVDVVKGNKGITPGDEQEPVIMTNPLCSMCLP